MKNVLVIGNGGREHALAWKLSLSPRVQCVYVAPGNGGTALEARVRNISIPVTHLSALADFADREAVDFTVVGPEAPLAAGIVDLFRARGLRIFGPTRACAQLESSKALPKRLCSGMASQPPHPRVLLIRRARIHMWSGKARPLSSRRTGWPPAKV